MKSQLAVDSDAPVTKEQWNDAMTGILGMMRFSRHDSPVLLEALGELQEARSARQLAYRSYMSASRNVKDPDAKERYQELASYTLKWSRESLSQLTHIKITESDIEQDFVAEREDADIWFAKLAEDERNWIASGEAVDKKFNEKYRSIPEAISTDRVSDRHTESSGGDSGMGLVTAWYTICAIIIAAIAGTLFWYAKQLRNPTS